jgi:hypothetical protein
LIVVANLGMPARNFAVIDLDGVASLAAQRERWAAQVEPPAFISPLQYE